MVDVPCNLCGSTKSVVLHRNLPDYLLGRSDAAATIVKCTQCGFVFQNPRPSHDEMPSHYPDNYEMYRASSEQSRWLRMAADYGNVKRSRYVTRFVNGGRLLDVGCATGTFLRALKGKAGWELFGIEPNAAAAEQARREGGLAIMTAEIDEADFPEGHFDAVTMWDVLEHLPDPLSSLRRIRKMLRERGIIVMRVPNLDSLDASIFGKYWAGWDPPRHLSAFNPKSATRLLAAAGFEVIQMDGKSAGYATFLISLRFAMDAKFGSSRVRNTILAILQHPFFHVLSVPVFYPISQTRYSGQLVITAAKVGS